MVIVGPILDMVSISYDVESVSFEECDARKLMFTVPFYCARGAQLLCPSVATPWGYKAGGPFCTTYIFPHDLLPSPCLLPHD
jgi:hypothetical protein